MIKLPLSILSLAIASQSVASTTSLGGPGMFNGLPLGNPYKSFLPKGSKPNYEYWQAQQASTRKLGRETSTDQTPSAYRSYKDVYDTEAAFELGLNDSDDKAVTLNGSSFRIMGRLYSPNTDGDRAAVSVVQVEENDTSSTATNIPFLEAGIEYISEGVLGDGPELEDDYDVFKLTNLNADLPLVIKYNETGDPDVYERISITLFDHELERIGATSSRDGESLFGGLVEKDDPTMFLVLSDYSVWDKEELDDTDRHYGSLYESISYKLSAYQPNTDIDSYSFQVAQGQVISVSHSNLAIDMTLSFNGEPVQSGGVPSFSAYPENGALSRTDSRTMAYTAQEAGIYTLTLNTLGLTENSHDYEVKLAVIDSSNQALDVNEHQLVFLDFNGATLNGRPFNGYDEMVTLSPLSEYIEDLGLNASEEEELIREVSKRIEQKIKDIIPEYEKSGDAKISFTNSLEDVDSFGEKNVSRLIIGGSQEELRVSTIGIAESVDAGNFDKEETAIVLLDSLSYSYYGEDVHSIENNSTHFDLVAETIAVVAAHELGHILSAFHTDNENETANIMDEGGDLLNHLGVGEDGIFGTDDDIRVAFAEDEFSSYEGFEGSQNTPLLIQEALDSGVPKSKSSKDEEDEYLGLGSFGYLSLFVLALMRRFR